MNNQKKSPNKLAGFLTRRQFRYGGYATVMTAIVIAVVILLNVALGAIEDNWALSIDVTAIGATDFDEQTEKVVAEVNEEIHVYTLFQDATSSSVRVQVEEVLNKYHAMNGNITFSNIDPVKNPGLVQGYSGGAELSEGALILTNADESRVKLVNRTDYYYYYTSSYNSQTYTIFDLESKVTSALMYVTSAETPRVFYLNGHGELDSTSYCTVLTQQLENQNYDVAQLNLTSDVDVTLEAGDTVVIINPVRDLSDAEYETLRQWLANGGRMMFVLNYDTNADTLVNFTKLLDYYQLSFGEGVVKEDSSSTSNWNGDYYTLVPAMDAEHDITAKMAESNQYLMMPKCRPINAVEMPESGLQFTDLLTTSSKAVVQVNDTDSAPGTQTVARAMLKANESDPTKDIRIVLLGSYYSMADTSLLNYAYNMNFTMNAFNWLVNRADASVDISSKLMANNTLAIPDIATAYTLAGIVVIAIPLIVLVGGIVVWRRRRSL